MHVRSADAKSGESDEVSADAGIFPFNEQVVEAPNHNIMLCPCSSRIRGSCRDPNHGPIGPSVGHSINGRATKSNYLTVHVVNAGAIQIQAYPAATDVGVFGPVTDRYAEMFEVKTLPWTKYAKPSDMTIGAPNEQYPGF